MSFLLECNRLMKDPSALGDIANTQTYEVTAPQFAIDGEVEEGAVARPVG